MLLSDPDPFHHADVVGKAAESVDEIARACAVGGGVERRYGERAWVEGEVRAGDGVHRPVHDRTRREVRRTEEDVAETDVGGGIGLLHVEARRIGRAAEVCQDVGESPAVEDLPAEGVVEVDHAREFRHFVGVVGGEDVRAVVGQDVAGIVLPVVIEGAEVFDLAGGAAVGVGGLEAEAVSEALGQRDLQGVVVDVGPLTGDTSKSTIHRKGEIELWHVVVVRPKRTWNRRYRTSRAKIRN